MYGLRRLNRLGTVSGYETPDGVYRITRDSLDGPDRGWWVTVAASGEAIHPRPFERMRHAVDYLHLEEIFHAL